MQTRPLSSLLVLLPNTTRRPDVGYRRRAARRPVPRLLLQASPANPRQTSKPADTSARFGEGLKRNEMAEEHSAGARRRWLVDVARWRPSPAQFQAAAALLPPHHHPAIARFVKEEDRKRALISRLLQYSLVHHVLGIPFHQIDIGRTTEGKPYLENGTPGFRNFNFNTSHQGDYVGIASELICLVGVDIVCISKPQGETTIEFLKNFSSYLTDHEWNCIDRARGSVEMLTEFYRYWSLKEAFVKAVGAGVGFGLHRLEFHHVQWSNISVYIDGIESTNWSFCLFKLDETHLASAKGHPEDAVNSFKRTLSNVIVEEDELYAALEIPEEMFTLQTVEQLIQLQK